MSTQYHGESKESIFTLIAQFFHLVDVPRDLSEDELADFGQMREFVSSSLWDELYGRPDEMTRFDLMMQMADVNEALISVERVLAFGYDWTVSISGGCVSFDKGIQDPVVAMQTKVLLMMRLNVLRQRLDTIE